MKRYLKSETLLARALETIPLGTQTFSKSVTQYPFGVSPFFAAKAKGCHLWDVDGNDYIDCVSGLLAILLGYGDSDVDYAVKEQLESGVIFSLPHPLEVEVSEKITEMIPSAELVRFGKNGSDATSGAIRLSRAFTKRDRIAVCGYHGWQDWYIGATTRDLGIPNAVKDLTHRFTYNSAGSLLDLLNAFPDEFAAVIMEPTSVTLPADGFLQEVRRLCSLHGIILIFDEIITGFRFARGGAQELFGVTPDLTVVGKGMSNGFPLSAVAGRRDIMKLMEDVFFSFTAGGEALSLAASNATLSKIQQQPVVESLASCGSFLKNGCALLIAKHGVEQLLSIEGHPAWSFLLFRDADIYSQWEIKSLWMQEIQLRGVLCLGTHNINYCHTISALQKVLDVYDEVFPILRNAVNNKNLYEHLNANPIEPLFKVR